jgi:MFS family permease
MATSPAWNAWVGALVPVERRAHFFARRARLAQSALLAGVLTGGLLLDAPAGRGDSLAIFALLFALAGSARLVSSRFLAAQSEPEGLAATHRRLPLGDLVAAVRASDGGRVLAYLLCMQVAVHVASPFFTPYMLRQLDLSYSGFMTLTAAAFVARIAVLPLLGPLAHRVGTRPVLRIGAVGIVPLPALWLVSENFAYLLAVQVAAGVAWAAVEYATQLAFFESLDERDRASILTFFNLASTLAMVAGTLLGAVCFELGGAGRVGYGLIFLISTVARVAPLVWLRNLVLHEIPAAPVAQRTLAVRPSAGALQRPVLASLEAADAAESDEEPGPSPGSSER